MAIIRILRNTARPTWLTLRSPHHTPLPTPAVRIAYRTVRFASDSRPIRDDDIKCLLARLVNPETKALGPFIRVKDLLEKIRNDKERRRWQSIELVRERPEPIIKLVDQRTEFRAMKEQQKQKKLAKLEGKVVGNIQEKEIQMTWGVAPSDLNHKLKKAREVLQQGHRVSIVFAPKRGQAMLSPDQRQQKVEEAMQHLADVGQQWKTPEVRGHTTIIYLKSNALT